MAKINFYLRDANTSKITPILLYVSYNGERLKLPTNQTILPEHWNEKDQKPRKSLKEHPEFTARLRKLDSQVNNIILKFQNEHENRFPTKDELKEIYTEKVLEISKPKKIIKTLTLFEYLDKFIIDAPTAISDQTDKPLSYHTIKGYRSLYNVLKEFSNQNRKYKKLDFKDIDLDFYLDFQKFLSDKKQMAVNTIGSRIKNLKAILNHATEYGVNDKLDFKKKRFKILKEETDAIYLTVNELNILESLELSYNSKLDRVRDLFLVGCWTGLRFADFSKIKSENIDKDEHGEFIEVQTQKTGKTVVVPILPTVQRIVSKYDGQLPKSISNQKMNDYLKEIGQLAGFDSIESKTLTKQGMKVTINKTKSDLMTTHTARRSFASNNYLAGMPTISIMAITGHSTERSFMRYIKLTPREHANKIREGWNNLLQPQQPTNNILKLAI